MFDEERGMERECMGKGTPGIVLTLECAMCSADKLQQAGRFDSAVSEWSPCLGACDRGRAWWWSDHPLGGGGGGQV